MTFAEAVDVLARVSGWTRREVIAKPDDCLWAASGVLVEARNRIRVEKEAQR